MKTPAEIARETFATMHSQAAEACENEILAHIITAIEADRAQLRALCVAEIRTLGEPFDNTEYTRGQVELLASLTSGGDMDTAMSDIYKQLGIDPL